MRKFSRGQGPSVVIVIAGPPCAGKSTIAAEVARQLGIPHLSMDAVRQRILPGAAHTRSDRQVAYRTMLLAAELAPAVVLDAPYGHAEDRDAIAALHPLWVECSVSPEEAVRRYGRRGFDSERPDLTEELVRDSAAAYAYGSGLVLDTEAMPVEDCVAVVLRAVRAV